MSISIAGDYAVARHGEYYLYYGYEVTAPGSKTDEDEGEWCFQAEKSGEVVATWSASELELDSQYEVTEGLMLGAVRLLCEVSK